MIEDLIEKRGRICSTGNKAQASLVRLTIPAFACDEPSSVSALNLMMFSWTESFANSFISIYSSKFKEFVRGVGTSAGFRVVP